MTWLLLAPLAPLLPLPLLLLPPAVALGLP
jgi:hypothetical protein